MDDGVGWGLAAVVTAVLAFVLLVLGPVAGQDYFPGFEVAAQADVVHVTSNILADPEQGQSANFFSVAPMVGNGRHALPWTSGRRPAHGRT